MEMGAMSLLSGAMSAIGAIQQGQAQADSQRAQAQANEYNAIVARNNAVVAQEQSNAKEEAQRRHFGELQGQARAGIAQSGTGFDGSNADILKQNAINNELDALTIRYQGENQAKGLVAQAQLDQYNASVNRQNASAAETGGFLNAGAALMSGYSKYQFASRMPQGYGVT
jgi:hypothetical protein